MYEQKVGNFIKIVDMSIPSLLFKQRCLGMQIDTRTAVHIITSSPHLLSFFYHIHFDIFCFRSLL